MKRPLTLMLLCCAYISTYAQNLVPNSNFDLFSSCPSFTNNFPVLDWINPLPPTLSTPDYYNECAGTDYGVPTNFAGFQFSEAGSGYCGVAIFEQTMEYREYIVAELTSPTIAGACYELTIIYSPAENAGFCDNLAMLLSDGIPSTFVGQIPQLKKTTVQESLTEWHTLTFQYVSVQQR